MRNPPSPHPSLHPNRRERRHGRHRMEEPPRTMLAGRRVVVGVAAFAVASVGLSAVSAGASNAPQVSAAVPGIDLSHTTTLPSTADELDAATAGSLDLPTLAAILRAGAILGANSAPGAIPGLSAGLPDLGSTAAGLVPQGQDPATATATDIPARVLLAYRAAAARAALENPSCGIRWEFLAAFGRMETNHGRFGGSSVAENGVTTPPIYGAPLNGSRPGVIGTITTASGAADRAAGPMQFISSTWAAWGRGGDVQNIDDATNGAARYLCAGGRDLTTAAGRNAAALSYNHADWYAADIEALFLDYVSGRHGASYPAQPPVDAPVAPTGDLFGTPADAPAPTAATPVPAPSTGTPTPPNTSPAPTSAAPAPSGNPTTTTAPAPSTGNPTPTPTAPAPTSATPAPSGNPTTTTAPAPSTGNPTPTNTSPAPTSATPAPTDATRAPATTTAPAPSTGNPTPTNTSPAPTSTTPPPGNPTSTAPAPRTTPSPTSTPPPPGTPTPTAPATPTLNLTVVPTPATAPGASPQATPDLLPVLPVPLAPGVLPRGGR